MTTCEKGPVPARDRGERRDTECLSDVTKLTRMTQAMENSESGAISERWGSEIREDPPQPSSEGLRGRVPSFCLGCATLQQDSAWDLSEEGSGLMFCCWCSSMYITGEHP